MDRSKDLERVFRELKQELSQDLIPVALQLCARFSLSNNDLATKWEAYILNHAELKEERPTRQTLKAFEADLTEKSTIKIEHHHKPIPTHNKESVSK